MAVANRIRSLLDRQTPDQAAMPESGVCTCFQPG